MVAPDTIQFPNNPVSDFLTIYEQLKGVPLIKDATLLAGGANLSLTLNQPVTKEDAIRLIESTLLLNGYAFIAVDNPGQQKRTDPGSFSAPDKPFAIKVINTQGGKNPRSEGVFLAQSPEQLPEGEVITSYVMQLDHLAAADAVPIFEQFITLHPYGSLVPVPLSNQVLITENSSLIRRLLEVKELVDLSRSVERKFVQLDQANADRVVEIITKILEKRAESKVAGGAVQAATGQPVQPPGAPPVPTAPGSTGRSISSGTSSVGDIQLIADTRTNRILVIADAESLKFIVNLIHEFDVAVDIGDPFEQPLNYVAASDMLPILADMLKEEGEEGGGRSRPRCHWFSDPHHQRRYRHRSARWRSHRLQRFGRSLRGRTTGLLAGTGGTAGGPVGDCGEDPPDRRQPCQLHSGHRPAGSAGKSEIDFGQVGQAADAGLFGHGDWQPRCGE